MGIPIPEDDFRMPPFFTETTVMATFCAYHHYVTNQGEKMGLLLSFPSRLQHSQMLERIGIHVGDIVQGGEMEYMCNDSIVTLENRTLYRRGDMLILTMARGGVNVQGYNGGNGSNWHNLLEIVNITKI